MSASLQVVFCMDTEGPCADPGNPELLATWEQVDAAMDKLFDPALRDHRPDSAGGSLAIGWFFLTWTGFATNPRGRDMGYHHVRDHYLERYADELRAFGDEECWHYHHPPANGVGNEWGLDWAASDEYEQILSRQLLERDWFPTCFRAGGTILTPELSRFVDAWFPIDFSNRAPLELPGLVDWSTGITEWKAYHPSPEDFRRPGAGRRLLARCLDLRTTVHTLTEDDVAAAFRRAHEGQPAILSVFDHDYRDIAGRVEGFCELVASVAARFPGVPWTYAAPAEAIRRYLGAPPGPRPVLEAVASPSGVSVWSTAPLFQSFPWLAVRTAAGDVAHVEAGLVRIDETHWHWTPADGLDWEEAAFGGSTALGEAATVRIGPGDGPAEVFLRRPASPHQARPRSIWEHSKTFARSSVERASGRDPELDSTRQALTFLLPRLSPGSTLLDVGCAGGHLQRSLAGSGIEYNGIDSYERGIEIGRQALADTSLPAGRLRALPVEALPPGERYDAVVCLSTLLYFPAFQQPLEAMARAAVRFLVIRSSFGEQTDVRYLPDVLLEEPFRSLRAYFSVFSRSEVQAFLEAEGFLVRWEDDWRQRERFGGAPEVVGGIELPYEFLIAERVVVEAT